jgi:ADP-ribose pyrophosphatase YjhB (NUDIX family)
MECRIHKLVVDVALLAEGRVLLTRYRDVRRYDGQHGWFLPDDFLTHGEDPGDGARRVLRDQAGIEPSYVRLDHIESFADGAWHLIFHHVAELPAVTEAAPGDNVEAATWFPLDGLPSASELAHGGWAADVLDRILATRSAADSATA